MPQVLVTGAAGFIGSHLCETLIARGCTVRGLDSFTTFYDPRKRSRRPVRHLPARLDQGSPDAPRPAPRHPQAPAGRTRWLSSPQWSGEHARRSTPAHGRGHLRAHRR
ncbi:MAG: NAD-dependent epimerase/dehydratase family protein [Aeromicrobium sp.]